MWGRRANWESISADNEWKALSLAVVLLCALLALPYTARRPPTSHEPLLRLELNTLKPQPEINIEQAENKADDLETQSVPAETPVSQPELPNDEILTQQPVDEARQGVQVHSQSFRRWLEHDTRQYIENNPGVLQDFAATFKAVPAEQEPDIKYEQGPLGGGNYKVRRNGMTCEQLVMVPMSFDDHLSGTISTAGNCVPNNPIKLDLERIGG